MNFQIQLLEAIKDLVTLNNVIIDCDIKNLKKTINGQLLEDSQNKINVLFFKKNNILVEIDSIYNNNYKPVILNNINNINNKMNCKFFKIFNTVYDQTEIYTTSYFGLIWISNLYRRCNLKREIKPDDDKYLIEIINNYAPFKFKELNFVKNDNNLDIYLLPEFQKIQNFKKNEKIKTKKINFKRLDLNKALEYIIYFIEIEDLDVLLKTKRLESL